MQNHILLVNHIGYDPSSTKKVIFQSQENLNPAIFCIRNSNNETLFEGKFTEGGKTDYWHTGYAFKGDFSHLQSEGSYQISCNIENQQLISSWFRIEKNIIQNSCLPLLLEGFQSRHPPAPQQRKSPSGYKSI